MIDINDIKRISQITVDDLMWKPIHPNNMKCNGIDGYYCLLINKNADNKYSARKYSIIFQHEEVEKSTGFINPNKINAYILFEKSYYDVMGPHEYPLPEDDIPSDLWNNNGNTFSSSDINDYGHFVYAYDNIDDAKKRALTQYKGVHVYVASHFID